ncbi:MAG TPA: hypothetical protein DCP63_09830 [Bacteroidetes bacterium]|nr:hypothetical protein [Bacteroidota bacterium]
MKSFKLIDRQSITYIRRFSTFLRTHARWWLFGLGFMLLSLVVTLPLPWLSMKAIDDGIQRDDERMFLFLILLWTIATLLRIGIAYVQGLCSMKFQLAVGQEVRGRVVHHILNLPLSYFTETQVGYLTTRLFQDTEDGVAILGTRLIDIVRSLVSLLVGIGVIFVINWKLAFLSVALVPFFFINQILYNTKIRLREQDKREAWAKVVGYLQEGLTGVYTVKAYGRQEHETEKFIERSQAGIRKSMESWATVQGSRSILGVVQGLAPIFIFTYAGYLILNKMMTVGELVGFIGYSGMLFGPASSVFEFMTSLQIAIVSLERIYQILDTPPEEEPVATQPPEVQLVNRGDVVIRNVRFTYPGRSEPALDGFGLSIMSGEAVGLVGRTGSGKTTVVNLLLRLYRAPSSSITIDGIDINLLSLATLREAVCVIPQEPFLFSGTILDNIRYGRLDAPEAEIARAAARANLEEFILGLPRGYQTELGERGVQLSGGQKQMISIARAFLRNPKIIILDEATSAVDSQSEHLIKEALEELMKDRTSLIISHRLSSILGAGRVVVLEKGKIVQEGSHRELYARGGTYRKLFEEQLLDGGSEKGAERVPVWL